MSAGRLFGLMMVFAPISLLSFGGGQATIPEMQRQTVALHGWLTDAQFADLYAISRAAPGPSTLIVALIGWQVSGFLGAVVATLAIFVPSSILMYFASSWWLRNDGSVIRTAIEQGLAPVAVGLVFRRRNHPRCRARGSAGAGDHGRGLFPTKYNPHQYLCHGRSGRG